MSIAEVLQLKLEALLGQKGGARTHSRSSGVSEFLTATHWNSTTLLLIQHSLDTHTKPFNETIHRLWWVEQHHIHTITNFSHVYRLSSTRTEPANPPGSTTSLTYRPGSARPKEECGKGQMSHPPLAPHQQDP